MAETPEPDRAASSGPEPPGHEAPVHEAEDAAAAEPRRAGARAADGDADAGHWRQRALEAERWRDEVWKPLLERAAEGERARDLERRLAEIESSTWWRVAAPWRAVTRVVRGRWSRLREGE